MNPATADRITRYIAVTGGVGTVLVFLLAGDSAATATLVGGIVSLANWLVLRWVMGKLSDNTVTQTGPLMALLLGKMFLLMAVSWGLLSRFELDPMGYVVGVSSIFVGITLGVMLRPAGESPTAVTPAEES